MYISQALTPYVRLSLCWEHMDSSPCVGRSKAFILILHQFFYSSLTIQLTAKVICVSELSKPKLQLSSIIVRTDHFNIDSMKELFEKVQADSILAYLKEINSFDRFKDYLFDLFLSTVSYFYSINTLTLSF